MDEICTCGDSIDEHDPASFSMGCLVCDCIAFEADEDDALTQGSDE